MEHQELIQRQPPEKAGQKELALEYLRYQDTQMGLERDCKLLQERNPVQLQGPLHHRSVNT